MAMKPFSVINDLNKGKEPETPEDFDPWLTNTFYSLFPDTLYLAEQMNLNSDLSKEVQLSFYINTVRPSKRWRKWPKRDISEDLKFMQEVYGFSESNARTALASLSSAQLKELKKKYKRE